VKIPRSSVQKARNISREKDGLMNLRRARLHSSPRGIEAEAEELPATISLDRSRSFVLQLYSTACKFNVIRTPFTRTALWLINS